jgi:hypothetical protein
VPQKLYARQRMAAMARALVAFHKHLALQRAEEAREEAQRSGGKRKRGMGGEAQGARRRKAGPASRRADA